MSEEKKQLSAFQIYWRDLKENHHEEYEKRLQRNADRIRKKRHAIYADKEKHEAFKAKNRAYYQKRRDRLKAARSKTVKKDE